MTADQFLDLVAAAPVSGGGRSRRRKYRVWATSPPSLIATPGRLANGAERRLREWTEAAILRRSDDKWRLVSAPFDVHPADSTLTRVSHGRQSVSKRHI